jgi:hypothetical protein
LTFSVTRRDIQGAGVSSRNDSSMAPPSAS